MKNRNWDWVTVVACFAPAIAGCSSASPEEEFGTLHEGLVWGTDDRTKMTNTSFTTTWPHLRSVGWIETPSGWCTGTLVAANTMLTATHCLPQGTAPNDILFHPAFVGTPNSADETTHPSVRGANWFNATAYTQKFFGYVPGSDWAIVHLDPATYQRGSASYPATLAGLPTTPVNLLTFPLPVAGLTSTHVGYSADFLNANSGGHWHTGKLRLDGICSSDNFQRSEGPGVVLSDIERNGGSSGGPIFTNAFDPGSAALVATIGGGTDGTTMAPWSQNNANREISSASFAFAPWQAAGLAFANDNTGKRWTFASDSTWINGLRFTAGQNPTYPHYPASNWFDFRDAGTTPVALNFGRMGAATTTDSHMWVGALDSTGQVWNKYTSNAGTTWSNWEKWFPGNAFSANARDVALAASGPTTIRVHVLHNDCTVEVKRKTGVWNSAWNLTQSLGNAGAGCNGLAVSTTGNYQQLFASTSSTVVTQWESDGAVWSGWVNFADGLPAITPVDIAAGLDISGRMMVVLLARQGADTVIYTRRKSSAVPGSAWNAWSLYASSASVPAFTELKDATQIVYAPQTTLSPNNFQSIFVISKSGGMYNPAYSVGTVINLAPYYAPYTPDPLPGPGVAPCP